MSSRLQQEFKNIQIDKTVPVEGVCLFPPENMHCWRLKMKDFDEDTEDNADNEDNEKAVRGFIFIAS